MADPSPLIPPPDHHHHEHKNSSNGISMLCYALVIVGTASVILGVANLLIVKWCAHRRLRRAGGEVEQLGASDASGRFENPARRSLLWSLIKYRKEEAEGATAAEQECAVCLSAFEEGEEVRQLPGCKHSFHAPCIDMWLSSHSDCPLCRTPVRSPLCERAVNVTSMSGNSREGLLDSGSIP